MIIFFFISLGINACNYSNEEPVIHSDFKKAAEKRSKYAKESESNHVKYNDYFENTSINGIQLRIVSIGKLKVTSGRIVACDPFYVGEEFTLPFEKNVKPGNYPVILCLGDFKYWGERVAFAQLKFSDSKPARWELAKTIVKLKEPETFYGVDAGLGCFVDIDTANLFNDVLTKFNQKNPNGNYYDDLLSKEFKEHENWNNHYPKKNSDSNIIMFSSGFGDGVYSSYWGLDEKGNIICLVTDFQLFTNEGSIFQD